MPITYQAKVRSYKTDSGDIWDIIALRCYGDTRAMHHLQDANFLYRFTGFFPANIELEVPQTVTIENDLNSVIEQKYLDIKKLLPWR